MSLDYLINRRDRVWELALEHLTLAGSAVLIALLLAIPLGVLAARNQRISTPLLSILGAIYTIPSLAFLALLIPSLGIGRRPAIVVLAAYAQIFLVRNIATGLRGVNPATLEAATGLGMTRWQQFIRVRWPLALPVMIAGLRTAAVTTISLATVAAWIGAGGLGTLLFEGITRNSPSRILAGAIAITALALLTDAVLRFVESQTAIARARRG
ncbi:MAG: ABC transporter permease [Chloroflexota bacterium]|nr:ABC transporter permease [Chloroflexia bacterium]MDQ3227553.1 ABC transporter permease [Chloroflexota bacterium]